MTFLHDFSTVWKFFLRLCGKREFACWNKRRGDGSGDIRSCTLLSFCTWLYRGWPVAHMAAMLLSRPAFAGVQKPLAPYRSGQTLRNGPFRLRQSDRVIGNGQAAPFLFNANVGGGALGGSGFPYADGNSSLHTYSFGEAAPITWAAAPEGRICA